MLPFGEHYQRVAGQRVTLAITCLTLTCTKRCFVAQLRTQHRKGKRDKDSIVSLSPTWTLGMAPGYVTDSGGGGGVWEREE